jgi:hypothetical protein
MSSRLRRPVCVVAVAALAWLVSCNPSTQDAFFLVAEYMPGHSDWRPWTVVITGSGLATQEVYGAEKLIERKLSRDELRALIGTVDEVAFLGLRVERGGAIDAPRLSLHVLRHGRYHRVSVSTAKPEWEDPRVVGFLKVWRKVLELVPSPNPGDRPELYGP